MTISEEIEYVEREFVPGNVLLDALHRQEAVLPYQLASWFLRNLDSLNRLPFIAFNRELRDFREIEKPWTSELFYAVRPGGDLDADWDEAGDGYIGGWCSSELKRFFSGTGIAYPEAEINNLLHGEEKSASINADISVSEVSSHPEQANNADLNSNISISR